MPEIKRYLAPAGLVAGGMLAGALLSTSLSASASGTDSPTPSTTSTASPSASGGDDEKVCRPGGGPGHRGGGGSGGSGRGERPAELTGTAATKVKAAVLAKYPGATVERMHADRDGDGYVAHIVTKDGTHLRVTLSEAYAVTGAQERPDRPARTSGPESKPGSTATPTPTRTS